MQGMVRVTTLTPTIRLGVKENWQENVGKWIGGYLLNVGEVIRKGSFEYYFYRFRLLGGNVAWAELPRQVGKETVYERVPVMDGDIVSVKLQRQGHALMQHNIAKGFGVGSFYEIEYKGMRKVEKGDNAGTMMHDFDIQVHPSMRDVLPSPQATKLIAGPDEGEPFPPLDE